MQKIQSSALSLTEKMRASISNVVRSHNNIKRASTSVSSRPDRCRPSSGRSHGSHLSQAMRILRCYTSYGRFLTQLGWKGHLGYFHGGIEKIQATKGLSEQIPLHLRRLARKTKVGQLWDGSSGDLQQNFGRSDVDTEPNSSLDLRPSREHKGYPTNS
jgi:hypothetical protein